MNDTATPEQIAFAHKRAYRLTSGPKTYKQHVESCTACQQAAAAARNVARKAVGFPAIKGLENVQGFGVAR